MKVRQVKMTDRDAVKVRQVKMTDNGDGTSTMSMWMADGDEPIDEAAPTDTAVMPIPLEAFAALLVGEIAALLVGEMGALLVGEMGDNAVVNSIASTVVRVPDDAGLV